MKLALTCMESGGVDFSSRRPAGRAEAAVLAPQPASSAAASKAAGIHRKGMCFILHLLLVYQP